jgi:hypothetical protein
MRKLASIQKIVEIRPIAGADKIEIASVLGWECVVAKSNNFKVGDLVIYIETDSILPDMPHFEFMRKRKFRVKAIKLRGVYSYGLILPLPILPNDNYKEGDDVTKILGIEKYDPELTLEQSQTQQPTQTKLGKFLNKFALYRRFFSKAGKRGFPLWITKTDETRIQAMPWVLDNITNNNITLTGTEKIDGCSGTFYLEKSLHFIFFKKYAFGYCSRNVNMTTHKFTKNKYFKDCTKNFYKYIAEKYKIDEVLKEIIGCCDKIVIQGEIVGPGIQGNKYKLADYELYVFNLIYYTKEDKVILSTKSIQDKLAKYGLKTVPILYNDYQIPPTINELIELSKGESQLYPTQREGIVWRNTMRDISFKVINPEFLIKNEE